MNSIRQGVIIPVYNHGDTVGPVVDYLVGLKLPVILVDDGSYLKTKFALNKIEKKYPDDVVLLTRPENGGKGAAVLTGIEMAHNMGLTHVLQIDADAQHDYTRTEFFLQKSMVDPRALIGGCPEFDASVPTSRLKGRKITTAMVSVETLSHDIKDAMCGFRVYPVEDVFRLKDRINYLRMGFDIEILVKLHWAGVPMEFYPVKVRYPEGGTSNFHMVRDNIEISELHTGLFFGMLFRKIRGLDV